MHDFKNRPVPYNTDWPALFKKLESEILNLKIKGITYIEHIGSTSVPDLTAKPVIDVLISFDRQNTEELIKKLLSLKFECKNEYGIADRTYFTRESADDFPAVHIHAFPDFHNELIKHLAFRDYLRINAEAARQYNDLKLKIMQSEDVTAEDYQYLKSSFIADTNATALAWYHLARA